MDIELTNFPTQVAFASGAKYVRNHGSISVAIVREYGCYRIEVWSPERDVLTNKLAGPARRIAYSEKSWLMAKHWAAHYAALAAEVAS